MRMVDINRENWELHSPFSISRDTRTSIEVIVVSLSEMTSDGRLIMGWGECRPYARYGETPDGVVKTLEDIKEKLSSGLSRDDLQSLLPPGAARNAVDCALIDFEASMAAKSVPEYLNLEPLKQAVTAQTISLDTVEAMGEAANKLADAPLIKVKLDNEQVLERLKAVRANAPKATLFVDANEAWSFEQLASLQQPLKDLGVALIEQPLAEGEDDCLINFTPLVPLCADESCHDLSSLKHLKGRYQVVNIKLDKTGGLSEAIVMAKQAKQEGFEIFLGCMVSTSLAIAPSSLLWSYADYIDLDGPAWLKVDRDGGFQIHQGQIKGYESGLWGHPFSVG